MQQSSPSGRPYVICHMVTSIDGKILSKRWGQFPGGDGAGGLFETTAATFKIPAWIVGTTTMREFSGRNVPLKKAKSPVPPGDFIAQPKAKSLAIGTDAKAALRFQKPDVDGDHTVVLVTADASDDYRAHLRDAGVSYLVCGRAEIDLKAALRKLHKAFNLKKLMLQGGGRFNGAMLKAGLVDEISQLIVPVVDGGGPDVTGVFDGPDAGRNAAAHLKVTSHRTMPGGVHWFRYKVAKR